MSRSMHGVTARYQSREAPERAGFDATVRIFPLAFKRTFNWPAIAGSRGITIHSQQYLRLLSSDLTKTSSMSKSAQ